MSDGPQPELDLWIFGYGSLVWKPAFPHAERRPGVIHGWRRRFWQGSVDHRGVPEAPGRVVTLVPEAEAMCWGVAYRVRPGDRSGVLANLDHRERGGFDRHEVTVDFPQPEPSSVQALVYIATERNANFLGPAPLDRITDQIRRSHGPSGPNIEYALRLADSLREIEAEDDHVFEIAARLRGGGG